jgi:hypothetical protein
MIGVLHLHDDQQNAHTERNYRPDTRAALHNFSQNAWSAPLAVLDENRIRTAIVGRAIRGRL